jgi:hypothetical protein
MNRKCVLGSVEIFVEKYGRYQSVLSVPYLRVGLKLHIFPSKSMQPCTCFNNIPTSVENTSLLVTYYLAAQA